MAAHQEEHTPDTETTTGSRVVTAAASVGGRVLGGAFGAVARVRGGRPLHPQGATYAARVTMSGKARSAVPWLDEPGWYDAVLRVSRAMGLPLSLPDIYGVALRVDLPGSGPFDLLFASTGDSAGGRFVLRLRPGVEAGPLTTLLPVRSPKGPLVLRLVAATASPVEELSMPAALVLSYAHGTGPWRDVGDVVVGALQGPETEQERHDPVLHQLPGTEQYAVVSRLREPAYRAARAVRPRSRRTAP